MDTEKDLSSSRAESSASTGAEYTSRPSVNPNAVLASAMRGLRGTRTRRRRPDTHFEDHQDMWPKLQHTLKRPRKQHHHSLHVASQPSLKQQASHPGNHEHMPSSKPAYILYSGDNVKVPLSINQQRSAHSDFKVPGGSEILTDADLTPLFPKMPDMEQRSASGDMLVPVMPSQANVPFQHYFRAPGFESSQQAAAPALAAQVPADISCGHPLHSRSISPYQRRHIPLPSMLAPACVTPMNSLPAPLVSHAPPQRPLPPSPFAQPLARRVASPTCLQAITSAQHLLQRLIDSQDLPLPHNVASQLPSVSHCQQSVPLSLDQVQVPNLAQAIPYFQGLLAAQRSALYQPDETAAMPLRHAGSNYACMAAELAAQSCTGLVRVTGVPHTEHSALKALQVPLSSVRDSMPTHVPQQPSIWNQRTKATAGGQALLMAHFDIMPTMTEVPPGLQQFY